MFRLLAIAALLLHLIFILWIILGTLFTRRRRLLSLLHIGSLLYVIVIEVTLLPCPLTAVERWALQRAGLPAYGGGFLEHYLQIVIYPHVPLALLVPAVVAVCLGNLGIYVWRWRTRG